MAMCAPYLYAAIPIFGHNHLSATTAAAAQVPAAAAAARRRRRQTHFSMHNTPACTHVYAHILDTYTYTGVSTQMPIHMSIHAYRSVRATITMTQSEQTYARVECARRACEGASTRILVSRTSGWRIQERREGGRGRAHLSMRARGSAWLDVRAVGVRIYAH